MEKGLDIIPIQEWDLFPKTRPMIIAGPCSAESREQVLATAEGLKGAGTEVFRAGIWKPRTHPGCFEGIGEMGLDWLNEVQEKYGMKVCTEVAGARHVKACLEHRVDMVWIGARTTTNPFLMQEIADALSGHDIPVLVKNPVNADIELWIGALERLNHAGLKKIGAIHRGFTSFENTIYRNNPLWQIAIELRSRYPKLPLICDPSHMGGNRLYVRELSQRALDFGYDGLMIETHCNPDCALSDSKQQVKPGYLHQLVSRELHVRDKDSDNASYKEAIERLRSQIDLIDDNILAAVSSRMAVSRDIGKFKKDNNIAIVQAERWDQLIADISRKSRNYGLNPDFLNTLFNTIHQESIRVQNQIIREEED